MSYGRYVSDVAGGYLSEGGVAKGISNMISSLIQTALQDSELGQLTAKYNDFMGRGVTGTYNLPEKIQEGLAKTPFYTPMADTFTELSAQLDIVNNALHAGLVGGVGSSFAQYVEGLMGTGMLLKMYKGGAYVWGVAPFVDRYYRSIYTPNEPDMHVGFAMVQRGNMTRADWNRHLAEDGWGGQWWDKLYNMLIKTPDPFLAFSMKARGIITEDSLKVWLKAYGIYDGDLPYWLRGLYHVPSLGEMVRISDFVELPGTYISQTLRGAGYTETDITLMTTALMKRPNREEVRSITTQLIWMYQHGRISLDDLTIGLDNAGVLTTELNLDLERAELQYGQQLIQEALQVIEYRVEYNDPAVQTLASIKTAIQALGILEETANLLAEQFYYHYVYSPP